MGPATPYLIVLLVLCVWWFPVFIMNARGRRNWGMISVFLPFVNLLILRKVVLEPATPDSLWADRFYGENMMEVAQNRWPLSAASLGERQEKERKVKAKRAKRAAKKGNREARRNAKRRQAKARHREVIRPSAKMADAKAKDRQLKKDSDND